MSDDRASNHDTPVPSERRVLSQGQQWVHELKEMARLLKQALPRLEKHRDRYPGSLPRSS